MANKPGGRPWRRNLSPASLFLITVLLIIAIGGALLMTPLAHTAPDSIQVSQAFFTAVSAVTVTGLSFGASGADWTLFGQIVIAALMFVGGLGFMTGFILILTTLRQSIGTQNRLLVSTDAAVGTLGSVPRIIRNVFLVSVSVQSAAAALLFIDLYLLSPPWDGLGAGEAAWHAIFHAVSSFSNGGFDILPDTEDGVGSLAGFSGRYLTLSITMLTSLFGYISYPVIQDLWNRRGRFGPLHLDTKLILVGTLAVAAAGTALILLLEFNNPATLGGLPIGERLMVALFEGSTARVSGLTVIDQGGAMPATQVLNSVLMFIGGAAGSTSGGLKVATLMILVLTAISLMRGSPQVVIFRRTVSELSVRRALMAGFWMVFLLISIQLLLTVLQPDVPPFHTAFEAISALATVGLSLGITDQHSIATQFVLMVAMLVGRYGIVFLLLRQIESRPRRFGYPEESVRVG